MGRGSLPGCVTGDIVFQMVTLKWVPLGVSAMTIKAEVRHLHYKKRGKTTVRVDSTGRDYQTIQRIMSRIELWASPFFMEQEEEEISKVRTEIREVLSQGNGRKHFKKEQRVS